MNTYIERIKRVTEHLRQQIVNHEIYQAIHTVEDLQIFMQYHIYAVWDFMSILKALQNNLTCTTVPWFPQGTGDTRFLINEIVAGEESDVDAFGIRKSHFELYLEAMQQCGADTAPIYKFISVLKERGDLQVAYQEASVPAAARDFVDYTFKVIRTGESHLQAAIFTFGREDLIPGMFHSIINDIHKDLPDRVSIFKYYLDRHIEVDGDHHSHLALEMTSSLCGMDDQRWAGAEQATIACLQQRIDLWDGAYAEIMSKKALFTPAL
jgi:hypothetical protein